MPEQHAALTKLEQILSNCETIERGFRALQEKLDAMPESDLVAAMRRENRLSIEKAERQVQLAREAVNRERAKLN